MSSSSSSLFLPDFFLRQRIATAMMMMMMTIAETALMRVGSKSESEAAFLVFELG
jgi:hypothetical protein